MSEFIRPQVSVEEVSENLARVSAEPLERGYGDTLGNSLRRVLLSSLGGAAVKAIQSDGVQHEFTTIPGVFEDVTEYLWDILSRKELLLLLTDCLKKLRLRLVCPGNLHRCIRKVTRTPKHQASFLLEGTPPPSRTLW